MIPGLKLVMAGPSNVIVSADVIVWPFTVTEMVPLLVPAGITMVNCVAVAETTSAVMPLTFTISFAGFVSKLDPVIIIFAPIVSDIGAKLLMVGVVDAGVGDGSVDFLHEKKMTRKTANSGVPGRMINIT